MSKCLKCGTISQSEDLFCRVCGAKLLDESVSSGNLSSASLNNVTNVNQMVSSTANSQVNQNNLTNDGGQNITTESSSKIVDEDLLDSYIGKNVSGLKNKGFSFNVLFFGIIYIFYRKMWLLGITLLTIVIISILFLPLLSVYIIVATKIYCCIKFKELYLKEVEEQVDKIKEQNPNKTKDELMQICKKKGGTTIIPVVLLIILYIAFFILVILYTLGKLKDNFEEKPSAFEKLSVEIPSNFKINDKLSNDDYKLYTLSENDSYCTISFRTIESYIYDNDAKSFLERNMYYTNDDTYSGVSPITINNNNWYYGYVVNDYSLDYYYSIINDEKIYEVEFNIVNDSSSSCSTAYNKIINSMRFD